MSIYQYKSGLNNAASYQVSGKPFITGSIDLNAASDGGTEPFKVEFPTVTSWLTIKNNDNGGGKSIKFAFSRDGLPSQGGTNYIEIPAAGLSEPNITHSDYRWKVTQVWLEGTSTKTFVYAGLTGIETKEIVDNWSGSAGV
tara:strand:- start:64 stop:486 length:423 start_codon:yes stop_codon:yes gene_type:complete